MGSIQNTVHYCCVSKGNRTLYVFSDGDPEIENLATLCLERVPPYHRWYFETIGRRTFGFLIEDSYVYFSIVDEGLRNPGILQFLEHVRDEFKRVARKGSRGSFSGMNSANLQEQLVPVIQRLITTLEHVSQSGNDWASVGLSPSPSNAIGQIEAASSTKAPLLGKPNKQEKRKSKDHVIAVRDTELDEHRKSTDRGTKVGSTTLDSDNQVREASPISLQKDLGLMRSRSNSQIARKKWWRQVRIILAIDVVVCLILLTVWLLVCGGFRCIR